MGGKDETEPATRAEELREMWSNNDEALNRFWEIFQEHYLPALREQHRMEHRQGRAQTRREPRVGEVVIMMDAQLPRGSWKLAMIENISTNPDGPARTATVRTPTGRLMDRAVNHLYPLEVTPIDDLFNIDPLSTNQEDPATARTSSSTPRKEPATARTPLSTSVKKPQMVWTRSSRSENLQMTSQKYRDQQWKPQDEASTANQSRTTQTRGNSRYNLRPKKISTISMALLVCITLLGSSNAMPCPNNTVSRNAVVIHAENCVPGGGDVVYHDGNLLCYVKKKCSNSLRSYTASNVTCGESCVCPSWSDGCSWYSGKLKDNSTLKNEDVRSFLSHHYPKVCSFSPSPECSNRQEKGHFNRVQLYDGEMVPVDELRLTMKNHLEPICIRGGEGKERTGSTMYCMKNKCVDHATTFCTYHAHEVTFYSSPNGQVAIRAWGTEEGQFYPYKNQQATCEGCSAVCTTGGVTVTTGKSVRLIEACTKHTCERVEHPEEKSTDLLFSHAIVSAPYEVQVIVHEANIISFQTTLQCPAAAFCESIKCTVCWKMATNLQCAPRTLIIILVIFGYALTTILSCIASCFICTNSCLNLLAAAGRALIASFRWIRRRWSTRRNKRLRPLKFVMAMICIVLVSTVSSCDHSMSIQAENTDCIRNDKETVCHITNTVSFGSISSGETICLQLKDPGEKPIATVTIKLGEMNLICEKVDLFTTRNYRVEVASSKRCPSAGSCTGQRCATVKENDSIPELGDSSLFPGFTRCQESCGCLGCGCFLCSAGCLFYRVHARPAGSQVYTVFECPSWIPSMKAEVIKHTLNEDKKLEVHLTTGAVEELEEVRIQLNNLNIEPLPLLHKKYLTDGRTVSALDDNQEIALRKFQCGNTNFDSCILRSDSCECTTYDELATCHCPSGSTAEEILRSKPLPALITNHWMRAIRGNVVVESNRTSASLQVSVTGWKLSTLMDLTTCRMDNLTLSGCHSCSTGAVLQYRCGVNVEHALGHVHCDNGMLFNVICTRTEEERTTSISYDRSLVDTMCSMRCGTEVSSFPLQGTLVMASLYPDNHYEAARQSIPVIIGSLMDLITSSKEHLILAGLLAIIIMIFVCSRSKEKMS